VALLRFGSAIGVAKSTTVPSGRAPNEEKKNPHQKSDEKIRKKKKGSVETPEPGGSKIRTPATSV